MMLHHQLNTVLFSGLLLVVPAAFAAPFYIQETCSCEPIRATANTTDGSFAECERIAAQVQSERARKRRTPYLADIWMDVEKTVHVNINPSAPSGSSALPSAPSSRPYIYTPASTTQERSYSSDSSASHRHSSAIRSALDAIASFTARARLSHKHCAPSPPQRHTPKALSVLEQLALRHPSSSPPPLHSSPPPQNQYNIICRARGVSTNSDSIPSSSSTTSSNTSVLWLNSRPVPVLFIFLAMVLAATTIVEWVIDTWQRQTARIQLEGGERLMYAVWPSSLSRASTEEQRCAHPVFFVEQDVEKRGEAANS